MNVWNKVFLGVIFVTAILVVALAAVEFRIRNAGQKRIADLEKRIEETVEQIDRIHAGADPLKLSVDKPLADFSLGELRGLLRERYVERGRAWFGCRVAAADERTLPPALQQVEVQIVLTSPFLPSATGAPTVVAPPDTLRGIVYVFDEGTAEEGGVPDAGTFLGRFTVEGTPVSTKFRDNHGNECDGWRVTLITSDPINEEEIDQIFDAATPQSRWAIYLTPPMDRVSGIFSQLTDEARQMIPEELLDKFAPRPMPELTEEYVEGLIERLQTLLDDPHSDPDARERAREAIDLWIERLQTLLDDPHSDPDAREHARDAIDLWKAAWDEIEKSSVIELWKQYQQTLDNPESELANDFAEVLDWLYLQLSNALRNAEILRLNIGTYEATYARAQAENEKLENVDIPLEEKRVHAMTIQRDAVQELLGEYEAEIDRLTLQIAKLEALIKMYRAGITEAQFQAAEKIEEQMRNAANAHEEVR